ncbi:MOSC domain-containing protein YiiM [Raineyella antarctica]|uniref:MOSC domain-containing protein YiiM n=1 Tax=Raineyella antarctica TaxID=1577474 RepID=A0A1G6HQN0_9ACTN|nr:MOSC domain-containing protein [Raineyella antarctica]SDB96550.1 MOSC domain-containing protein YiiM [Raineyella antarctica]
MIRLEHVCVAHQVLPIEGRVGRTGIDKRPVDGPVEVGPLQLAGDAICDTANHGGRFRAVYVVSDEDAAVVGAELGRTPPAGWLGENLRVSGTSLSQVLIGERWRIGSVEIAFTEPRIPCRTFAAWVAREHGPEAAAGWVKRFTELGRPGGMAEVLVPGTVRAGQPVEVAHRPAHGLTLGEAFAGMPADKAAALLAAYAPEDIQPDMLRRARAAATR